MCTVSDHLTYFLCVTLPQLAQNLAQINDLQAQLEEALKEKQEFQEKVDTSCLVRTIMAIKTETEANLETTD